MIEKLKSEKGQQSYALRMHTFEPVLNDFTGYKVVHNGMFSIIDVFF